MTQPRLVPVVPITSEAFEPYGRVFTSMKHPPAAQPIVLQRLEDSDLSGGRAILAMIHFHRRDFAFTHMEQHASFTQAFLPADGMPAIVVVARPVGAPGSAADLDDLKAFLLDGTQGIMLGKGIWHCPLFPIGEEATYAMATCVDTPADTEAYVDVSALAGTTFQLTL